MVRIAGASGITTLDDTKQAVTDDYVPVDQLVAPLFVERGL